MGEDRSAAPFPTLHVRPACASDHADILALYNGYVVGSAITFDVSRFTLETRRAWFAQFTEAGRHRLLVAEAQEGLLGYAASMAFGSKAAYETSVETSVYCRPDALGRGVGARLYTALFEALRGEDLHRAYAGITLPNPASVALHRRFGFHEAGVFREVGRKFGRWWDVAWFERAL